MILKIWLTNSYNLFFFQVINIFCLTISRLIQQALEAELCHQALETFRSRQAGATLAAWTRSDRLATCLKWSAIRRMPSWMEPRRRPIDPMSSCTPVFSFLELLFLSPISFFLFVSFCPLYCFCFIFSLSISRSIVDFYQSYCFYYITSRTKLYIFCILEKSL